MESRFRILFLSVVTLGVLTLSGCSSLPFFGDRSDTEVAEAPEQVIEPEVARRDIVKPKIDTEDFEIGVYGGLMSVEDFGVNTVVGATLAYHFSESLFVEAAIGRTDTEETSFELLSGAAQLLTDDEREFTYYNASVGWNLFPGEAFFGRNRAFNQSFYLIAGLGSTRFGGDDLFTVNAGAGYRLLFNDVWALRVDFRDHVFDSDLLGTSKTVHNLTGHIGFTLFF
ncbi:MAG: outer membrane beta-barrel domain-containing protein [Pseudomonadota bacterium]